MSIYIPGMEPPKPDEVICIYNNGEARKCPLFEQKVIEVSVAIPVPEHGDLIDRDALVSEHAMTAFDWNDVIYVDDIKDAPAVIPAEDDTDFHTKGHLHLGRVEEGEG